VIKSCKLGVVLRVGMQIHHDHLTLFEPLQPGHTPSQHLNFARYSRPQHGIGCGMIRVGLRVRIDVTITKVGEPLRNVAGFMVLEELMDAASAQSGRRGNVSERESGIMGRNDGPDTFALGFF